MNCIDSVKDDNGKLFTCGHFDLVIYDEAHRSIYNKYRDIFNYFDAPLIGLTATPKDEIDKNTYGIFDLENGVPTYGYELAQAVKDGYLVDFIMVESKTKFIEEGIAYDELSEEDKAAYGHKPLGEFVREIVGLDMNAAKEAFLEFLDDTNLDSRQIYFVNQIVEYIVHNGMMKDLSVLQESPFTDKGSVAEIFTDMTAWMGIRKVIDQINTNAAA